MDNSVDTQCTAICANGNQCTHKARLHGLCGSHLTCQRMHGPHTYELMQLKYTYRKRARELATQYNQLTDEIITSNTVVDKELRQSRLNTWYTEQRAILNGIHAAERANMRNRHAEIVEMEGRDPDAEANERRRIEEEARAQRRAYRYHHDVVVIQDMIIPHAIYFAEELDDEPRPRELGEIAVDPQGVHTVEVIEHTKSIVERVRTVEVPAGYNWSKEICSKTPGEIISECRLTPRAAWQMIAQYAQDTSIYDIEEGIYGKVLDSVWQFVKSHAERDSLVAILRSEMEDNIGMCAQGNLTRICNVLSGYLEGVGVAESLSEKLGRLLPMLRTIDDLDVRHARAIEVLLTNKVPVDDWETWMDPVMA